ncbi:hypothetical protein KP509_08G054000 [Ceratopteris richardii]|uniref:Mitochondrial import inner membrane translocase subunit n=1 Tax=Ceratopteris richardii TaxID=49495 RepID=A0A8T2UCH9_CERRI|nr:hypothetical protein KP509_08G054000 [Ceratopteris richardii]
MDPFSSSSGANVSQPSPEAVIEQVQRHLAEAYAEELFNTVRDKCFMKCVTKPSSSLSGSESSCISRCVDRYMEATGIISRAVFNSIPREY